MPDNTDANSPKHVSRRSFLARSGAVAASCSIINANLVHGSSANSKVKLGLSGCGGRGIWISRLFAKHGGYILSAVADYFQDRVDRYGDLFEIPQAQRYTGLSAYKRMLEKGDIDAIAVESPPYFHPEQAAAGVDAGKHVYVAKPIAVDVPGCRTIEASGHKATRLGLCFQIDFQTRANDFYKEALRRVHDGDIGQLAFGEAYYHAGFPFPPHIEYMKADPTNPENRLRGWGLDKVLSGDIITEQNIHTLDVMNWIMGVPPIQASGANGHKVRDDGGDCHDSFMLVYQYPDNVGVSFTSRQFEGYKSDGGIKNRMYGSDGVLETEYGGEVLIRGKKAYKGGNTGPIFEEGAANNIATFHKNIMEKNVDNPTIEPSVRSNLITVLGRSAAYSGDIVTWDEMLKKAEKLEFKTKGLKD